VRGEGRAVLEQGRVAAPEWTRRQVLARAGGVGARCGWRERCAGVREAWSKCVSGTRSRRRWSEARGVAAREQKRTGVAECEQKTGGVSKT
jgi:hypothetical protein